MIKDDEKQTLAEAFAAFNAHSIALHQSYAGLQERLSEMAVALRESRAAERRGQVENERLNERLGDLLEVMPAAVIEVAASGQIIARNAMALELFGQSLAHDNWKEIVSRHSLDITGNTLFHHAGRVFSLSCSPNRSGGYIFVLSDVSEAEANRVREQRQSRLAMLGEMAARVAHQIRTPLATAMLYATNTNSGSGARDRIVARLRELEAMVDDMLLFARGTPPADEALNSADLLHSVAVDASVLMPKHVSLKTTLTDGGFGLRGNRRALTGAIHNLIANAAQHCHAEVGVVELRDSLTESGQVRLSIRDNGQGIDPALQHQIFEPFFTTRPDGTGLGLAVVRSVAQAHDGSVECRSDEQGTEFSILLPTDLAAVRVHAFSYPEYAHG
ncbi:MAG: ATP-binding protein [Pseudomonadota bacterium]